MTEAEAIKVLEKEKAYMDSHGGDTQSKALAMAIKALEKQTKLKEWIEAYKKPCYDEEIWNKNEVLDVLEEFLVEE